MGLRQRISKMWASDCTCRAKFSLLAFVGSPLFVGVTGFLVVGNAAFIGYQTDAHFQRLSDRHALEPAIINHINRAFAICFVTEVIMRLLARRTGFFTAHDWKWNLFDAGLVCTSVLDEVLAAEVNFSASRVFRVFRTARVLRIIRIVPSFRELREMLGSILGSLRSVCWAITLLSLIMYLFCGFVHARCHQHYRARWCNGAEI